MELARDQMTGLCQQRRQVVVDEVSAVGRGGFGHGGIVAGRRGSGRIGNCRSRGLHDFS
jgi:hypothetical protein